MNDCFCLWGLCNDGSGIDLNNKIRLECDPVDFDITVATKEVWVGGAVE